MKVVFEMGEKIEKWRRKGRKEKEEEVERGESGDRKVKNEGKEGKGRKNGIGKKMEKNDGEVIKEEWERRIKILKIEREKELRKKEEKKG